MKPVKEKRLGGVELQDAGARGLRGLWDTDTPRLPFWYFNLSYMNSKHYINLESVKKIPIVDIMSQLGFQPVTRKSNDWAYHSPWREDKNASLHVRLSTNTWKDFGEEGSGTSNIDLVIRLGIACDWREAAQWLLENFEGGRTVSVIRRAFGPSLPTSTSIRRASVGSALLRDEAIGRDALLAYGEGRGISREVLTTYCRQVTFRSQAGRVYTAIGFGNIEGGYVLRYGDWIKCNIGPSSYSYVAEDCGIGTYVFEGFFDFLSFKMLRPSEKGEYYVLNSVVHVNKVTDRLKKRHNGKVKCFLDADKKGKEALAAIRSALGDANTVDESYLYEEKGVKDLNDLLVKDKNNNSKR